MNGEDKGEEALVHVVGTHLSEFGAVDTVLCANFFFEVHSVDGSRIV